MPRPPRVFLGLLSALGTASAALAQPSAAPQGPDAAACAALARLDLRGLKDAPTSITSARLVDVPAPPATATRESSAAVLAASPIKQYCQVTGYVAPQNKFELRLPLAAQWNQKFFLTLCDGFCGAVQGTRCNLGLARGYATATNNGGHDGVFGFDGVWAANAPTLQADFAWRSTHVTALAAKAITSRYYGRPIARSYISGCSKGGHGALMEIQRFPNEFDGAISAAPVYDWTGQMTVSTWFTQANDDGKGGALLDSAAMRTVHASILAACGAQAGVDEGLVTDPAACAWRPERAACRAAGPAGPERGCLTTLQVAAVRKLLARPAGASGRAIYPAAFVPGSETEGGFWFFDEAGGRLEATGHFLAAQNFLSFMAHPTSSGVVDPRTVDIARLPAMLARARALYDATSPDLRAFEASGGKLLMWHGLSDAAIPATMSALYHDRVAALVGSRARTDAFFRLFLLPGVHHCGGGPGPDAVDAIGALERWVEQGVAPDELLARKVRNGVVERSRPAYPYPARARYTGSGDPLQAGSFTRADAPARP